MCFVGQSTLSILAAGVLPLLVAVPRAQAAELTVASPAGPALTDDPVLGELVKEATAQRPEIRQSRELIEAENERVPRAGALPDPSLTLAYQNDGFSSFQFGTAETTWMTIMASQTFPWLGKRGLRSDVASLGVRQAETDLKRAELTVRAEVERGYVDLLLVRDQLGLLTKLEGLWRQSESLARARYEAGEGAQSDILRAQLELSRLRQRRFALEAEEQQRATVLNRLRGHPIDEPIPTSRSLGDVPDPGALELAQATADSEALSPELRKAVFVIDRAEKQTALARKDYFPDPAVSAGVMPRGKLDPMWQIGLSFSLPVYSSSKQSRAVAESQSRQRAAGDGAETVKRLLRQRVKERVLLLGALLKTNRLYRSGLLVQSETTVTSTVAQYQVGRVTFASVLEALAGYLADVNGFFESVAAIQRVAIAQREISLEVVSGPAAGGMVGTLIPGAGGMGAAPSAGPSGATPQAAEGGDSPTSGM